MNIELEETIVELLARPRSQAAARNMPFDAYLEQFVEIEQPTFNGTLTIEEFDAVLDNLSARATNVPPLPGDFSRADIYADHN